MAKKTGEGNVYNDLKEVLNMLRVDEDSDEEDFAESQPKLQEQESDRENDEQEFEDFDTGLSYLPPNEDLQRPSMPQQSQVFSRDGTIWNKGLPCTTGRQGKRIILRTKPGIKRFILALVNDGKDVFQELWEHQNFANVMHFSFAETRREGHEAFSLY